MGLNVKKESRFEMGVLRRNKVIKKQSEIYLDVYPKRSVACLNQKRPLLGAWKSVAGPGFDTPSGHLPRTSATFGDASRGYSESTRRGAPLLLGAMVSKDRKSVSHSPGFIGFVRRVLQTLAPAAYLSWRAVARECRCQLNRRTLVAKHPAKGSCFPRGMHRDARHAALPQGDVDRYSYRSPFTGVRQGQ